MKTISELNERMWYRMLKVFFVSLTLIVSGITLFLIINEYGPEFDKNTSYVLCDNGKKFFLSEYNIYSDYIHQTNARDFSVWCSVASGASWASKLKPVDGFAYDEDNYTFVPHYTSRDWSKTFGYSVIATGVILLIFELLRRIFYYVVLGSVRPRKRYSNES